MMNLIMSGIRVHSLGSFVQKPENLLICTASLLAAPPMTDQHNRLTNLDYLIGTSNLYSAKPLLTMAGGSCLGPPQTGSISCHPSQATADLAPAFQAEIIRVSDMIQLKATFVLEVWRFWKLLEGNGSHRTGVSKKNRYLPSQPRFIVAPAKLHIAVAYFQLLVPLFYASTITSVHSNSSPSSVPLNLQHFTRILKSRSLKTFNKYAHNALDFPPGYSVCLQCGSCSSYWISNSSLCC